MLEINTPQLLPVPLEGKPFKFFRKNLNEREMKNKKDLQKLEKKNISSNINQKKLKIMEKHLDKSEETNTSQRVRTTALNLLYFYDSSSFHWDTLHSYLKTRLETYGIYSILAFQSGKHVNVIVQMVKMIDVTGYSSFCFTDYSCHALETVKNGSFSCFEPFFDSILRSKLTIFFKSPHLELIYANRMEYAKFISNMGPNDTTEFGADTKIEKNYLRFEDEHSLVKTCVDKINSNYEEIDTILSSSLTVEEKDYQLKNRQSLFFKKTNPQNKIPRIISSHAITITNLLLKNGALSYDLSAFNYALATHQSLLRNPNDHSETRRSFNAVSHVDYTKLLKLLVFFHSFNFFFIDVGLLVLHYLVKHTYSSYFNKDTVLPDDFLDTADNLKDCGEKLLFKRTAVKLNVASSLISHLSSEISDSSPTQDVGDSSSAVKKKKSFDSFARQIKDLLQPVKDTIHLAYSDDVQIKFILDFIEELEKKDFRLSFDKSEQGHMSELVFSTLESLDIVTRVNQITVSKSLAKKATLFLFNEKIFHALVKNTSCNSEMPSLTKPVEVKTLSIRSKNGLEITSGSNELEALNYLNSIPYKINRKFTAHVYKNWLCCLKLYLKKDSNSFEDIEKLFILKNNATYLVSKSTYIQGRREYEEVNALTVEMNILIQDASKDNSKEIRSLQYRIKFISRKLSDEYLVFEMEIVKYSEQLANAFSLCYVDSFYFPWSFDFRFRMYPVGKPNHPQINALGRCFLEFASNSSGYVMTGSLFEFFKLTDKETNHFSSMFFNWMVEHYDNLKDSKSFPAMMHMLKLYDNNHYMIGSMDVTASAFQIFSGLVGNREGLLLTNFCMLKKDVFEYTNKISVTNKKDFYRAFLNPFVNTFNFSVCSHFKLSTPLDGCDNVDQLLLGVVKDYLSIIDRAFIKNLLMCKAFSEGMISRGDKIQEFTSKNESSAVRDMISVYFDNHVLKKSTGCCLSLNEFRREVFRFLNRSLEKHFTASYSSSYPDFELLQELFEKTLAKSSKIGALNKVSLNIEDASPSQKSSSINYTLWQQKEIKYPCFNAIRNRKEHYTVRVNGDKIDKLRLKNSLMPNTIHRLDAALLVQIILLCKDLNIPVSTAHDCFRVPLEESLTISKHYFESFIKLFLRQDVLTTLIKVNLTEAEFAVIEPKLKRFESNRKILLDEFDSGELVFCPFILTP